MALSAKPLVLTVHWLKYLNVYCAAALPILKQCLQSKHCFNFFMFTGCASVLPNSKCDRGTILAVKWDDVHCINYHAHNVT